MTIINKINLYTDGRSKGNPGPGAIGVVICTYENKLLHEYSECIGHCTNNQAEYKALVRGLELCARYTLGEVICFSDSELLVKQMNGDYRLKNDILRKLFLEVKSQAQIFTKIVYQHANRTNQRIKRADQLLNQAQNGQAVDKSQT